MKKIKILDTNVILDDPNAIFNYPKEIVILPICVIEELDKFKKNQDELGVSARQVSRKIDKLINKNTLGKISDTELSIEEMGITLNHGGKLVIELNHVGELKTLDTKVNDNRILSTAFYYKEKYKDAEVKLITKDSNLRIKANAFKVSAENYDRDVVEIKNEEQYLGYQTITLSDKDFNSLMDNEGIELKKHKFNPNEYAIIENKEKDVSTLTKYDFESKKLKIVNIPSDIFGLKPKNIEQQMALDLLLDPNVPLVTITGKAGTGKTLMATAAGLFGVLDQNEFIRMLVARPIVPMGKDIGYLPGPQPLDAKMLTPKGWTTMGELKIGDFVISRNGKKSKVLNIFKKGIKEIYKITTTDGTSTEACLDHLWETKTAEDVKRNRKGSIKTTKEMIESLKKNGKINHFLPRNEKVIYSSKKELPLKPYTLGCLIGDGTLGNAIVLSNTDMELIEKVKKEVNLLNCTTSHQKGTINYNIRSLTQMNKLSKRVKLTNIKSGESLYFDNLKIAGSHVNKSNDQMYYLCSNNITKDGFKHTFAKKNKDFNNPIKEIILNLGLMKKKCHEKFIPEIYKYSSVENRIELIRGLMDTDGCIKKNGEASFDTTSLQLANDLVEVVRSLGGRSSIRKRPIREKQHSNIFGRMITHRRESYSVSVSLPEDLNPFYVSRKSSRHKYAYIHRVGVVSIEPVGVKEAQCILIDNPEHLYLTNDFIVTHNTVEEKLNPWMQPIYDNLEFLFNIGSGSKSKLAKEKYQQFIDQGILQVEPLTYIRGRSIPNQFIIIDEAQNLSKHEIKTILSRVGEGAKIILTGDVDQIDNPYVDKISCGLNQVIENFKKSSIAGHVHLTKGERSKLAEAVTDLLK